MTTGLKQNVCFFMGCWKFMMKHRPFHQRYSEFFFWVNFGLPFHPNAENRLESFYWPMDLFYFSISSPNLKDRRADPTYWPKFVQKNPYFLSKTWKLSFCLNVYFQTIQIHPDTSNHTFSLSLYVLETNKIYLLMPAMPVDSTTALTSYHQWFREVGRVCSGFR